MTGSAITEASMQQIFTEARTHNVLGGTVSDDLLRKVYDLAKFGPTSANCTPMRIVFVKTKEGKERLRPAMDPGNLEKTMAAPVTAIIGQDLAFYEHLSFLFPHAPDARSWFEGKEAVIKETAMRNSSLQGAYFIIAARALGLDCGPMSGFNQEKVNEEFFKGTTVKSNFLCNLGYGDKSKLFPRSPRFKFEDVCKIA